MKKTFVVFVLLAALCGGSVFSRDFALSIGGGGVFDYEFGQGIKAETIPIPGYMPDPVSVEITQHVPWFGGFVFLDAAYAQLHVSILFGSADIGSNNTMILEPFQQSVLAAEFGLLGKYPFALNGDFTIFPLLGLNYNLVLFAAPYNTLGFQAGAGVDYNLNGSVYLRAEALFNFRLANKNYTDMKSNAYLTGVSTGFGLGPRITIGAGYRFQ